MTLYRVISDLHIKGEYQLDHYKRVLTAPSNSPEHPRSWKLAILGDFCNTHGTANAEQLHVVRELLTFASQTFNEVSVIAGNHDFYDKAQRFNMVQAMLPRFENVTEQERWLDLENRNVEWVPWEKEIVQSTKGEIVFAHFFPDQYMGQPGQDLSVFMASKLVIHGDIHKQLSYKVGDTTFWSVGSPAILSRGELNDGPKGGLDVDTETLEVFPFHLPDPGWVKPLPETKKVVVTSPGLSVTTDDLGEAFSAYFKERGQPVPLVMKEMNLDVLSRPKGGKVVQLDLLTAENFLSYKDLCLAFRPGTTLIDAVNQDDPTTDNNGAGKSAIFDAITFGIFQRTLRDLKLADVVRKGEEWFKVRLDFIVDGIHCSTIYEWAGSGKLSFIRDGEDVSRSTAVETKKLIQDTVGMDYPAFLASCVFGVKGAFGSLTEGEKRSVLDMLTGADRIDIVGQHAKLRYQEAEAKLAKAVAGKELAALKMKTVESTLDSYARAAEEWAAKWEDRMAELCVKRAQIEAEQFPPLTDKLVELKALRKSLVDQKAGVDSRVNELDKTISSLGWVVKEYSKQLHALNEGHCPTCGGDCSHLSKAEIKWEIENNEAALREAKTDRDTAIKERSLVESALERLDKQIRDTEFEDTRQTCRRDTKVSKLLQADEAIEKHKKDRAFPHEAEVLKQKATLLNLRHEFNQFAAEVSELEPLVLQLEDVIAACKPKGLPSYLYSKAISSINAELAEALNGMSHGQLSAYLEVDDDLKLKLVAGYCDGAGCYQGLSDGQKAKVDAAFAIALYRVFHSTSAILMADEYDRNLDATAAEAVLEELGRLDTASVLCSTHKAAVKSLFDRTITVIRKNGVSYVASEQSG